ncbi:PTS transporter subunit EIIC [Spiroplasma endosymbiont of Crioceris asparagi]|uniref:PTS transporter subunit EIIC n=1 Tax=Spiroplasma endosymbiont of Crioceris asparagi TaxID=3066286 RepID=UPI0030CC682B
MSKESKQELIVQNILDKIGGKQNVKDVYHCATRMRLSLFNDDLAKVSEIKTISNIQGALWSNGELQIIIGAEVPKITNLLKQKLGLETQTTAINGDGKGEFILENKHAKSNVATYRRFLKSVSAIFGPLIPFLIGVGLIMALQQLLNRAGVVKIPDGKGVIGVDYNMFDYALNIIASTGFKMMGVIAIWSTVRYLGGNPVIALALGLIMVSPNIAMTNIDNQGNPTGFHIMSLGSWDINFKPFYSTILVFIVMGVIVAYSQRAMERYFNPVANFVLNPFIILLIGSLMAFFIMGPIMGILENVLLKVFNWFMTLPIGIGTLIVGLTWQLLVVIGVHNILFFVAVAEVQQGNSSLFLAAAFAAAWAQMGAAVGVGLRSKKAVDKSAAYAAALPGIISGPTESCIYGVNLPKGLPFFTGVLAGGIGGWLIGIFGVKLDTLAGLGGIIGFLAYTNKLWQAIVIDLGSFGLGILITWLCYRETKTEKALAAKTLRLFVKSYKNDLKTNLELKVAHEDLKKEIDLLKELNIESANYQKLLIKKLNYEFKLNKIKEINEAKLAKMFDKGQALVNSKNAEKISKGNELIKNSEQELVYKAAKINYLETKIAEINNLISSTHEELNSNIQKHYEQIVAKIAKIEVIKNNNYSTIKDRYFNDLYNVDIQQQIIKPRIIGE